MQNTEKRGAVKAPQEHRPTIKSAVEHLFPNGTVVWSSSWEDVDVERPMTDTDCRELSALMALFYHGADTSRELAQ